MTYYPSERDAEDARHIRNNTLPSDDEQLALDRVIAAFDADDACDDEAADVLNILREAGTGSVARPSTLRHDGIDLDRRILLGVKARVAI